jgi:hypothetical protein
MFVDFCRIFSANPWRFLRLLCVQIAHSSRVSQLQRLRLFIARAQNIANSEFHSLCQDLEDRGRGFFPLKFGFLFFALPCSSESVQTEYGPRRTWENNLKTNRCKGFGKNFPIVFQTYSKWNCALQSKSNCRCANVAWQTLRNGRPIVALVAFVWERIWCRILSQSVAGCPSIVLGGTCCLVPCHMGCKYGLAIQKAGQPFPSRVRSERDVHI